MVHEVRLVDVPCVPQAATTTSVVVTVRGIQHTIPSRYVARQDTDYITLPEWYALEKGLLTSERCLSVADIANRLNVSNNWVYSNLKKLEADGFPKPVLSWGRRRWDPSAISSWLAQRSRRGEAPIKSAPLPTLTEEAMAMTRHSLAAAYGS